MSVAVTGVSAVNDRGEVALFIAPLPAGSVPTSVSQSENRLAIHSGGMPVSVRGYSQRTAEVAARKGKALVVELDEARGEAVRVTEVPIEAE